MKPLMITLAIMLCLSVLKPQSVNAQEFLAFSSDNYGGATSMFYQPASIVDSRYKFDMELFSFSTNIENNWWGIDRSVLFNANSLGDSSFAKTYLSPMDNRDPKNVQQSFEVRLLSFMLNISDKSAFGFSIRGRQMINFNNLDPDAANLILGSDDVVSSNNKFSFQDMSQQAVAWAEYGLTYSQVFLDNDKHFVKAGITGKLLQGMGAMYLYEKNLSYDVLNKDTLLSVEGDIRFGASSNFDELASFEFVAKPSIGVDFGFVYEYRPNHQDYREVEEENTSKWKKDANKYLFKVSFAVLDMGSMVFNKEMGSNDFKLSVDTFVLDDYTSGSIQDLSDSINSKNLVSSTDPTFKFKLPTTINLNIDFKVMENFYLNLSGIWALNQGFDYIPKAHYLNSVSLSPRYEGKWLGASMPMRINQFKQFNVGLGVRLGPLWIGSNNLLALTGLQNDIMSADLYFAIKIPIMY